RFQAKWSPVRVKKTRRKKSVSNHKTLSRPDVLTAISGSAMFWTWRFRPVPPLFNCGEQTMRLATFLIAAAALAGSIAGAQAVPSIRAGVLECHGGQNVGFVVGSVANLECVFQSPGRRPQAYMATVRRIGVDVGVTAQTQFTWAVTAPATRL